MSHQPPDTTQIAPIPVRVRRTIARGGRETFRSTVPCPETGEARSLKSCTSCRHFAGTAVAHAGTSVLCGLHGPEMPRRARKDATKVPVTAVMRSVVCARPELDLPALARLFLELRVSGLPVVDAKGLLAGVVTKTDLVRHQKIEDDQTRKGGRPGEATVGEIMTRHPSSIEEGATIACAAVELCRRKLHRLPVVSREGAVLGIVTPLDLLGWFVPA